MEDKIYWRRFNYMRIPDYVGEIISRVWILVYLWFTIQGQCVVVIPAALTCTSTKIMNIINHWRKYVHLELPTRPFGMCQKPPPAFRPYCCEGSFKLILVFFHLWGIISCYLIEVFASTHSGVASLYKTILWVTPHISSSEHWQKDSSHNDICLPSGAWRQRFESPSLLSTQSCCSHLILCCS